MFNDYQYDGVFPPVAMAFNYNKINDFMREWAIHFQERQKKEITDAEYIEWKLNWPLPVMMAGGLNHPYNGKVIIGNMQKLIINLHNQLEFRE